MLTSARQKVTKPHFTFEKLKEYAPDLFRYTVSNATRYANSRQLGIHEGEDLEQECALLTTRIIELANTGVGPASGIKNYEELKKYVSASIRYRMLQIRYDEYVKPNGKLNSNAEDITEEHVQALSNGGSAGIETVEQIDNRLYHQKRLKLFLDKVEAIQEEGLKDAIHKILKLYEDIPPELLTEMQGKSRFGNRTQIKFTIPSVAEHMKISLPDLKKAYGVMVGLYMDVMEEGGEGEQVNLAINTDYDGLPFIVDKSMFSHSYKCANPQCGRTVWIRPANAHEVKYCKPCKRSMK
jgi:hypothetical protein